MGQFSANRFTKLAIIILVILNLGSLFMLWLQVAKNRQPSRYGQPQPGPDRVQQFLVSELNLSSKQAGSFLELRQEHARQANQVHYRMRELRAGLWQEFFKPARLKTDSITKEIGQLQTRLENLLFNHFQKLQNVLDPDQRIKFRSLVQDLLRMIKHSGPGPGTGNRRRPLPPVQDEDLFGGPG